MSLFHRIELASSPDQGSQRRLILPEFRAWKRGWAMFIKSLPSHQQFNLFLHLFQLLLFLFNFLLSSLLRFYFVIISHSIPIPDNKKVVSGSDATSEESRLVTDLFPSFPIWLTSLQYPLLIAYSTLASITTLQCLFSVLFGPEIKSLTSANLQALLAGYVPFAVIPIIMLIDMIIRTTKLLRQLEVVEKGRKSQWGGLGVVAYQMQLLM